MSELEIALKAVQIYADMHPRPVHVTKKQVAEMLNLSEPTVYKLVKRGALKLNSCGLISITQVDALLEPH